MHCAFQANKAANLGELSLWPVERAVARWGTAALLPEGGVYRTLALCPAILRTSLFCRQVVVRPPPLPSLPRDDGDQAGGRPSAEMVDPADSDAMKSGQLETEVWRGLDEDWEGVFASALGARVPERIVTACCAQFAVSRDRIRLRPKAFYQSVCLLAPLLLPLSFTMAAAVPAMLVLCDQGMSLSAMMPGLCHVVAVVVVVPPAAYSDCARSC